MDSRSSGEEGLVVAARRLSGAFDAVALGASLHGATLTRALADAGVALGPEALAPVLDALLDDVVSAVDVDAASVRHLDRARQALVLHGTRGALAPDALPAVAGRGDLPCGVALEREEPALLDGAYVVPLRVPEGDLLGCVTLYRSAPWAPTARERRTIDALVRGALASADNLRLVQAARAEFAERQRTEDALRQAELRFRILMDANVIGIAVATSEGVTEANDEYLRQAGHTQADLATGGIDWRAITPAEYLPLDEDAILRIQRDGFAPPYEKEYVHPDGTRVRILVGLMRLTATPLTMLAFTLDVTARHAAEQALAERVADWEALFELMPFPLLIADDPACAVMRANAAYAALTGLAPGANASMGAPDEKPPYWPLLKGEPVAVEDLPMQRAARTGRPVETDDIELAFADGRRVRLASYAHPRRDAQGRVRGALGAFVDITERTQREAHARLLADVGEALAASLDYEATARRVARLVLPTLADWSVVQLVDGVDASGEMVLRRVAVAHADPARQRAADALLASPQSPNRANYVYEAIATRTPKVVAEVPRPALEAASADAAHLAVLDELAVGAVAVIPLVAGGRVRGAINFVREPGRAPFSEGDLRLLNDVAARASLALSNALLYREAQEAARVKGEFLAVMSHELRTPLQAILGYTGLLGEEISGPLTPAQRDQLGRVQGAAGHLLTLIDEVLTLSRLEAGREELFPERTDLRELVAATASMLEPTATTRGLALRVALPDAPVMLDVDPRRLRQVVLNLASNAIKFTERGHVTLRLTTEDAWVRLAVEDTGVGIAAAQLPRVFESFWRADGSLTRRTSGSGLGLTISRHLVTLMGGTIAVESVVGEGSTFTVRLPRRTDG